MKILVIDSHKSSDNAEQQNLHWINGKIISDHLKADYIWSYPTVNDDIQSGYDAIIFNHASNYSFESEEWISRSPNAELFYICNDYFLGEPVTLWKHAKTNSLQYQAILNHDKTSNVKMTKMYVSQWHNVNLNALVYEDIKPVKMSNFFDDDTEISKSNCIYYGTFRKGRIDGFKKYLKRDIILSTHKSNYKDFKRIGCTSPMGERIMWHPRGIGLQDYKFSLCIEDEVTYTNYSRLPNRFYEALSYNVVPIFDTKSKQNVIKSGYNIPEFLFVDSYDELVNLITKYKDYNFDSYFNEWKTQAEQERIETLNNIRDIIYHSN